MTAWAYLKAKMTMTNTTSFKKIRFVTDSTCDLPPDIIARYGIGVVPCFINQGEHSYADDGEQLIREDFYEKLPHYKPHPTTAAMPPALAQEIIERTFEGADHLFILSVSSKLSGVYNALRLGTANLPPDRVTLIDSLAVCMGMGWQVLIGAEVAEATGDVAQVKAAIEQVRKSQILYAALDTLEYLRKGGRVSWAAAGIGSLLQIKPIISVVEGEVKSAARVRTFSRAIDELVRLTRAQGELDRLAILYAKDIDLAHALHDRLKDVAPPGEKTMLVSITPTLGVHIGPGGVGVTTVRATWRKS
jgi:DegV family protein with EDD domain